MSKLWIQGGVGLLALTLAAGVGFAGPDRPARKQDGAATKSKEGRPERGELRKKVIEKFDKDGDGTLNEDERAAAREEVKKHRRGGPDGELRKKIIEKFDKDGDGKLNEEERAAAREAAKEHHKKPSTQPAEAN